MAQQTSIYQQPRALTAERHRDWTIAVQQANYRFAANLVAVPIMASEFGAVALEYPIVFARGGDQAVGPLALVGLRDGENLFVSPEGQWTGRYVPALLRQYPFGFAEGTDTSPSLLCIDEASPLLRQDGTGEALFDANGATTPYLNKIVEFANAMMRARKITQLLGERLKTLDLLSERKLTFTETDGRQSTVSGFATVDREKLHALPAETVQELLTSGVLELIHGHLLSLNCRERLRERLTPRPDNLH
ncbi:MAG: SapC family protein [Alphaproteobacteria bacterium]|nr:SapC family protein [Alphaproteobacteria bacterium]MCB9930353.1 SapC family protein [Alphaproteobacteria bacterium]